MLKKCICLGALIGFTLASTFLAWAVETEITEGMKQDEFALLLVEELGAERLLPPAAVISDYFGLLKELGIEPVDGWDAEGIITGKDLIYMLDLTEEEAKGLTFEELLENLIDRLYDVLAVSYGVRPPISPSQ